MSQTDKTPETPPASAAAGTATAQPAEGQGKKTKAHEKTAVEVVFLQRHHYAGHQYRAGADNTIEVVKDSEGQPVVFELDCWPLRREKDRDGKFLTIPATRLVIASSLAATLASLGIVELASEYTEGEEVAG